VDQENHNLKGSRDRLEYYRTVKTGTVEPRLKLLKETDEKKIYYYPDKNMVMFSEQEVRKFSLDSYGENIPYVDGELTIFNNYLFDYWGYYLNAEGLALYGHLKRYAYGKKDWCFPNFELIGLKMDKSRPTIHNYLDLLEHYGFVYQFHVRNKSKDGVEESPLFKVRKTVPLLTQSLIYGHEVEISEDAPPHMKKALKKEQKGLPERLRKEHEKYVAEMIENNKKVSIESTIDFEEIYKNWLKNGQIIQSSSKKQQKSLQQTNLEQKMNDKELYLLVHIKEYVKKKISKPSYDTWFKDIILKREPNALTIIAPNPFAMDWLREKYIELILEAVKEEDNQIETVQFESATT
jgi:hypothetical protein